MDENKRELIFLSYAHDDLDQVWKVYEGLKKRQVAVWFDKADLVPGKWKPQIEKIIPKCRYFIFCVSYASIKKTEEGTGFVEDELQTAWEIAKIQDEKNFTIIPVRLEDCERGDLRISSYQQYDLFMDFEKELDKLAVHIGGISLANEKARDERRKYGTVTVEIWDLMETKKQRAEIPDNAPVNRIVSTLVKKMDLPFVDPSVDMQNYKLFHKASDRLLSDNQTLAEANVHDGDMLRIQTEKTAGKQKGDRRQTPKKMEREKGREGG